MQTTVTKLAIKYKPPTFMIEYNTPEKEIFHRKISITFQNSSAKTTTPEELVEKITSLHLDLLGNKNNHILLYDKSLSLCKNLLVKYNEHLLEQEEACTTTISSSIINENKKEKTKEHIIIRNNLQLHDTNTTTTETLLQADDIGNQEEAVARNELNYGDLNKASVEELEEAKQNMNVTFEASCLKPGDDDAYEYDKREEFVNTELDEISWDSSTLE